MHLTINNNFWEMKYRAHFIMKQNHLWSISMYTYIYTQIHNYTEIIMMYHFWVQQFSRFSICSGFEYLAYGTHMLKIQCQSESKWSKVLTTEESRWRKCGYSMYYSCISFVLIFSAALKFLKIKRRETKTFKLNSNDIFL